MNKTKDYSANQELKKFFENDKDTDILFLDESEKKEKFFFKKGYAGKKTEIDAIIFHKNLILILNIKKNSDKEEIKNFFKDIKPLKNPSQLNEKNFIIDNIKENEKIRILKKLNSKISDSIKKIKGKYANIILKKIFFVPDSNIEDSETIDNFTKNNCFKIDRHIYNYFIEIKKTLGPNYFFRELYSLLKISKYDLREKSKKNCIRLGITGGFNCLKQENIKKYQANIFWALIPYKEIEEYVTVIRLAHKYDTYGFQRMIKQNRLKNISENFLDKGGSFPNNIIIAFNPENYKKKKDFEEENKIHFVNEYNSLIIIDGQHRFFSHMFKEEDKNKELGIAFVFFKGKDKDKIYNNMSKLFLEINDNQRRVTGVVRLLLKAKLNPRSPEAFWVKMFKKMNNEKKYILYDKISFIEPELKTKEERKKKSVVSLINYGGLLKITDEKIIKNKKEIGEGLGIFFNKKNKEIFCTHLFNSYFGILNKIGFDISSLKITHLAPFFRLLIHFVNYPLTKNIIKRMGGQTIKKEDLKPIENILKSIDKTKLSEKEYSSSNWGAIEGFYIKSIRKNNFTTFGIEKILSKKGKNELRKQ